MAHRHMDQVDRESNIDIVYVRAARFGAKRSVRCTRWFQDGDARNKAQYLPGRAQTVNCGLVFALREALKCVRQCMEVKNSEERLALLIVRSDATYVTDAMQTYLYQWRRNEWCKKHGYKTIANHIFWQSVNYELCKLEALGVGVKTERVTLPNTCIRF